ncbi:phosphogluconate dehydrogenase (NAD(+)-dependent, decarboxylating) [Anaeromyxobacter paludicola]|uniref:6-phosphogluconate dehydrogenase n=1 Tax=Anaeromyxobacter paludicola TaxID=2918171 RepID=A0ABN6ND24_9BACT|nr:decarboxylating 6-phosphogluconate dehydrogenase [Anaeromyxobacter paludicola]BDG10034.1 6-phosphogluconate dehydrogenase [Anaeromyxobacter paludicola]
MQLGMVGLGRMGGNMARRLLRGGHQVVGWDRAPAAARALEAAGGSAAATLEALVAALAPPRAVWLMVPAGAATEEATLALRGLLSPGDAVVDGGNTFFKDDVRRARLLAERGIRHLDAGTSGGVFGLERGYCLMVGGDRDAFERLEPALRTLAPGRAAAPPTAARAAGGTAEEGYLHCGPHGAGHFVKMVHNGIEYGLMQAYAEGFEVLRGAAQEGLAAEHRYALDLREIAELWRRGSVVTSWLLDLTAAALAQDPGLEGFTGAVDDSGEGRWTVEAAVEEAIPAPVLSAALFARFRSRQAGTFGEKLLSAMRRQFGGHAEAKPGGGAP